MDWSSAQTSPREEDKASHRTLQSSQTASRPLDSALPQGVVLAAAACRLLLRCACRSSGRSQLASVAPPAAASGAAPAACGCAGTLSPPPLLLSLCSTKTSPDGLANIPDLVRRLSSANRRVQAAAAAALVRLGCDSPASREAIVDAGCVPAVISLLHSHSDDAAPTGMLADSAFIIEQLAEDSASRAAAITAGGGGHALVVGLLRSCSDPEARGVRPMRYKAWQVPALDARQPSHLLAARPPWCSSCGAAAQRLSASEALLGSSRLQPTRLGLLPPTMPLVQPPLWRLKGSMRWWVCCAAATT